MAGLGNVPYYGLGGLPFGLDALMAGAAGQGMPGGGGGAGQFAQALQFPSMGVDASMAPTGGMQAGRPTEGWQSSIPLASMGAGPFGSPSGGGGGGGGGGQGGEGVGGVVGNIQKLLDTAKKLRELINSGGAAPSSGFGTSSGADLLRQAGLPGGGSAPGAIPPGTPFGDPSGGQLLAQAGLPGGIEPAMASFGLEGLNIGAMPFGAASGASLLGAAGLPGAGAAAPAIAAGTPFGAASGASLLSQAGLPGGVMPAAASFGGGGAGAGGGAASGAGLGMGVAMGALALPALAFAIGSGITAKKKGKRLTEGAQGFEAVSQQMLNAQSPQDLAGLLQGYQGQQYGSYGGPMENLSMMALANMAYPGQNLSGANYPWEGAWSRALAGANVPYQAGSGFGGYNVDTGKLFQSVLAQAQSGQAMTQADFNRLLLGANQGPWGQGNWQPDTGR